MRDLVEVGQLADRAARAGSCPARRRASRRSRSPGIGPGGTGSRGERGVDHHALEAAINESRPNRATNQGTPAGRQPDVLARVVVVQPQRAHVLDGLAIGAVDVLVRAGQRRGTVQPTTLQAVPVGVGVSPIVRRGGRRDPLALDEDEIGTRVPALLRPELHLEVHPTVRVVRRRGAGRPAGRSGSDGNRDWRTTSRAVPAPTLPPRRYGSAHELSRSSPNRSAKSARSAISRLSRTVACPGS